jgi:hypothetical protein
MARVQTIRRGGDPLPAPGRLWLTLGAAMRRAASSGAVVRLVPSVGSAVLAVFAGLIITLPFDAHFLAESAR